MVKNKLIFFLVPNLLFLGMVNFAHSEPGMCYEMKPVFVGPYVQGNEARTVIVVRKTTEPCGDMTTNTRAFYPDPLIGKQSLAVALTAMSLGKNIVIKVADTDSPSVLENIYLAE